MKTAATREAAKGKEACLPPLMGAGVDLDARDGYERTAASIAASNGHAGLASRIEGFRLSRSEAKELRGAAVRAAGLNNLGPRGPRL